MNTKRLLCVIVAAWLSQSVMSASIARADEVYNIVIKKQEEKAKSRWSLSDWLDTRDRMRMMDLWLALHSPSPFEMYFGGSYRQTLAPTLMGWNGYIGIYYSIFGLQFQYEQLNNARMYGSFHFRLFGVHNQATNITPEFGFKNDDGPVSYRSFYAGVGASLYFAKFFGIDGVYRHYFPSTPNVSGVAVTGDRLEGGPFIEVRLFRLYGTYFWEPTFAGTAWSAQQGFTVGGRFYL